MNLSKKLKLRVSEIQRYQDYRGLLHHMELNGEISNRMTFDNKETVVWCVNDYLGLMNNKESKQLAAEVSLKYGSAYPHATRATFGETKFHREFEEELADFVNQESAYLLNLGYAGICSIVDALTDRHDTIIYDQAIHACSIDGVRLHNGRKFCFKHNSVAHLETQIKRALKRHDPETGSILVIIDGVYSMHGEQAPLKEIVALKKKYDFCLLVDDSHGFGVLGHSGAGAAQEHDVEDEVDIYVATFTKAIGSLGAFVAGNKTIIDYLRYNTRSQIFSRTIPLSQLLPAQNNLRVLRKEPGRRIKLWNNTIRFQNGLKKMGINIGEPESPVTPIRIIGSIDEGVEVLLDLRNNGVFSYLVCYPVVPKGTCLIRMVPTYNHTTQDIDHTLNVFKKLTKKYPERLLKNHGDEKVVVSIKQTEKQDKGLLIRSATQGGK